MGNVLNQHGPPSEWQITLLGHYEDLRSAAAAVIWSQRETHLSHTVVGNGDEATAIIVMKLKDMTMQNLVLSILQNDHPNVQII